LLIMLGRDRKWGKGKNRRRACKNWSRENLAMHGSSSGRREKNVFSRTSGVGCGICAVPRKGGTGKRSRKNRCNLEKSFESGWKGVKVRSMTKRLGG